MPPAENGETHKYNLPPPVEGGTESIENQPEKAVSGAEISSSPKSPKTSSYQAKLTDFQQDDQASGARSGVVPTASMPGNPQIADDTDLIEKEWVAKAKKIIEEYKEDPFNQSKEMTLFKADYMKKRYNKTIKVSE